MIDAMKKRILAVDDNPIILRSIKQILDEKYDVYLATSGERALEMTTNNVFDLILLDYEMPGMNGKDTICEFRKRTVTMETPVIFLTGIADKEKIIEVAVFNPSGYILKPIDAELLLSRIKGTIN